MALLGPMAYPVRDTYGQYSQSYAVYQTRAHHPDVDLAQSLSMSSYAQLAPPPRPVQQPQTVPRSHLEHSPAVDRGTPQSQSAQTSPIAEDGPKPSLPSISNLLSFADAERPAQDDGMPNTSLREVASLTNKAAKRQHTEEQQSSSEQQRQNAIQQTQRLNIKAPLRSSKQSQEHANSQHANAPPPTPPFRSDYGVEGTQSPSTISTGSSLSAHPFHTALSINNVEPHEQRVASAHRVAKRHSMPLQQVNTSPFSTSPYATSAFTASPSILPSQSSYYSPVDQPNHKTQQPHHHSYPHHHQHPHTYPPTSAGGLYNQRPLPSNFPPPPPPPPPPIASLSTPNLATTTANPWEHHHYIASSSHTAYPNSQDRYICATCNKAFSRPSSLKIHSHSHTGEKPFKCPHPGCGKAFSVRSNMKRHERGCHTTLSTAGSNAIAAAATMLGTGGPMSTRSM